MTSGRRQAFTLVELMVAMALAALLAAAALMALYSAQEEARESRTRAQIAKLNELILRHYESYATRNVRFAAQPPNAPFQPRDRLLARLLALRDIMRMELPDRITDLANGPAVFDWGNSRATRIITIPSLRRAYQRRLFAALGPDPNNVQNPNFGNWSVEYQHAECLYLIVSALRDADTNALSFFRDTEISDLDGDRMPEILDGWGTPINFLRWAPGFGVPVGFVAGATAVPANVAQFPDRTKFPDFFDPLKVDPAWSSSPNFPTPEMNSWATRATLIQGTPPAAYQLYPLIFSAGADREIGLFTDNDLINGPNGPHTYSATQPLPVDPYAPLLDSPSGGPPVLIGTSDLTSFSVDNITNHLLEVR